MRTLNTPYVDIFIMSWTNMFNEIAFHKHIFSWRVIPISRDEILARFAGIPAVL